MCVDDGLRDGFHNEVTMEMFSLSLSLNSNGVDLRQISVFIFELNNKKTLARPNQNPKFFEFAVQGELKSEKCERKKEKKMREGVNNQ